MYVCVYMYVPIHHPHAQHAREYHQIDTEKIVSVDHVLTLNVAHQTTELIWPVAERLFEAQADLDETI